MQDNFSYSTEKGALVDKSGDKFLPLIENNISIEDALIIANKAYSMGKLELQNEINALKQEISGKANSEALLSAAYQISELTFNSILTESVFFERIHQIVCSVIKTNNFFIAQYCDESDLLSFPYFKDENKAEESRYIPKKLSNGYTELVIRSGRSVLLTKEQQLELYEQGITVKPSDMDKSWLGVPLIHKDKVKGAIVLQSYNPDYLFTEHDSELLTFVAQHISTAIMRRDEYINEQAYKDALEYSANHDVLTGLPNRAFFNDFLKRVNTDFLQDTNQRFSLMFIDLDGFKSVNDTLGHQYGDMLLKEVSSILKSLIRNNDIAARYAGDEFVLLVRNVGEKKCAIDIANRINKELSEPIILDGNSIKIGASIGIVNSAIEYKDIKDLIIAADKAMYESKRSGKGKFTFAN
ncbi:diguanylate cyclase domain-containing protein [Colwellia sp. MEBiC06753]